MEIKSVCTSNALVFFKFFMESGPDSVGTILNFEQSISNFASDWLHARLHDECRVFFSKRLQLLVWPFPPYFVPWRAKFVENEIDTQKWNSKPPTNPKSQQFEKYLSWVNFRKNTECTICNWCVNLWKTKWSLKSFTTIPRKMWEYQVHQV